MFVMSHLVILYYKYQKILKNNAKTSYQILHQRHGRFLTLRGRMDLIKLIATVAEAFL